MDADTKYKVASCLVAASILSNSLGLVAILIALPTIPKNTYDCHGVLVTILSILITILVCWNIYRAIEDKEKIKREVLAEVNKDLVEVKYEFHNSFIMEEIIFANTYMKSKEWKKTLSLLSIIGKRYNLIASEYKKNINILRYIMSVAEYIQKIDNDFIHSSELYGFMKGVFYPLAKYDIKVIEIYKTYDNKVQITPKPQPPLMEVRKPTSASTKK